MTDYKSLFKKDMELLHYIDRELNELNQAYTKFRKWLNRAVRIPKEFKHLLKE